MQQSRLPGMVIILHDVPFEGGKLSATTRGGGIYD